MGETGVNYDMEKFIYLGTPETAFNYMFVTRKGAGVDSLEKLRTTCGRRSTQAGSRAGVEAGCGAMGR